MLVAFEAANKSEAAKAAASDPARQAPASFDQFYGDWFRVFRSMALQLGLSSSDSEDAAQSVMLGLWQGDYLTKYNPEVANFNTFIFTQARFRLLKARSELWKHGRLEVSVSEVWADDSDGGEAMGGEDELAQAELDEAIARVLVDLERLPATETKDLARLFREMLVQVRDEGKVTMSAIASSHGWSRQAISQQVADLRQVPAMRQLRAALRGQEAEG